MARRSKKKNSILIFFGISGVVILSLLLFVLFTRGGSGVGNYETASSEFGSDSQIIKDKVSLKVKNILQNPELPTGCEITSLTTVLNYLGYQVDKMDMAKNYLKLGKLGKDRFAAAFIGEPWSPEGWGCYAPVIYESASKYLLEHGSIHRAYDLSGEDFAVLLEEVSAGNPVLVWTNIYLDRAPEVREIIMEDGSKETWITPEHCVVLTGYDMEKNIVEIADPLNNFKELDMASFKQRYADHGRQAVVVK